MEEEKHDLTQDLILKKRVQGDLEESSMVDDVNGEAPKVALKRGILEKLHHYQTLDAMFQLMVIRCRRTRT